MNQRELDKTYIGLKYGPVNVTSRRWLNLLPNDFLVEYNYCYTDNDGMEFWCQIVMDNEINESILIKQLIEYETRRQDIPNPEV